MWLFIAGIVADLQQLRLELPMGVQAFFDSFRHGGLFRYSNPCCCTLNSLECLAILDIAYSHFGLHPW